MMQQQIFRSRLKVQVSQFLEYLQSHENDEYCQDKPSGGFSGISLSAFRQGEYWQTSRMSSMQNALSKSKSSLYFFCTSASFGSISLRMNVLRSSVGSCQQQVCVISNIATSPRSFAKKKQGCKIVGFERIIALRRQQGPGISGILSLLFRRADSGSRTARRQAGPACPPTWSCGGSK